MLITYASYMLSDFRPGGAKPITFQSFVSSLPEIQSAVDRLLRRFPLLSLELEAGSERQGHDEKHSAIAVRCLLLHVCLAASMQATCAGPEAACL